MWKNLRQQVLCYKKKKREYFAAAKKGIVLYKIYYFTGKEKIKYLLLSLGCVLFLSCFFYGTPFVAVLLLPLAVRIYVGTQNNRQKQRKRDLETQFGDFLIYLSANLRAGFSVENAFLESAKDIRSLYGARGMDSRNLIGAELKKMEKDFSYNRPLAGFLTELGERSDVEHIREFGDIFSLAVKSGGNLPSVIESAATLIGDEISLKQEIAVAVSGKLFEQKIMNIIPFLLTGYIEIGNPGFFKGLYEGVTGRGVMTVCLFCYLGARSLANRILLDIL